MSASPSAMPWPLEEPPAGGVRTDGPWPRPVTGPAYGGEPIERSEVAGTVVGRSTTNDAAIASSTSWRDGANAWFLFGAVLVFSTVIALVVRYGPSTDAPVRTSTTERADAGGVSAAYDVAGAGADAADEAAGAVHEHHVIPAQDLDGVEPVKRAAPVAKIDAVAFPKLGPSAPAFHEPAVVPVRTGGGGGSSTGASHRHPAVAPVSPAPAVAPVRTSSPSGTRHPVAPGGGPATSTTSTTSTASTSSTVPTTAGGAGTTPTVRSAPVTVATPGGSGSWRISVIESRHLLLATSTGGQRPSGAVAGYLWTGSGWVAAYVLPGAIALGSGTGGSAPVQVTVPTK